MEVLGDMPAGRPKRTWRETVESEMEKLGISEELAMGRAGWRRVISKSNPSREGKKQTTNEYDDDTFLHIYSLYVKRLK